MKWVKNPRAQKPKLGGVTSLGRNDDSMETTLCFFHANTEQRKKKPEFFFSRAGTIIMALCYSYQRLTLGPIFGCRAK